MEQEDSHFFEEAKNEHIITSCFKPSLGTQYSIDAVLEKPNQPNHWDLNAADNGSLIQIDPHVQPSLQLLSF